jgi:putative nucleotidyltransferase with HDIG domain
LRRDANLVLQAAKAIVIDVALTDGLTIGQVQHILSKYRTTTAPIVAILKNDTRQERVQAAALGATIIFPAAVSVPEIAAALAPTIGRAARPLVRTEGFGGIPAIDEARLQFETIFGGVERGDPVNRYLVDNAAEAILLAPVENSIRRWLEVVWTYDDATYQHCLLVTGVAAAFATDHKFSEADRRQLTQGSLLHDVGKAKIPRAILNKPGALTPDEMAIMRTHPRVGYELLAGQQDYSPDILEVVLWHDELLDASGYPDGLADNQIADLVRLATICDIFSALIERRPYRPPLAPLEAFKVLERMEGKVEGALVRAFATIAEQSAARHGS